MAKNKTILISINTSWNIVNFRSGLIRALKMGGYTVISAAPDDTYTPRLIQMVDRHIHLPMSNAGTSPLQDVLLFLRYLRVLYLVKPAVLLTYTIKPNMYGALAARVLGIPIINNVSGLGTAFIHNNWLTHVVKWLYRFAFQRSACVFFQNSEDRDLFIQMKLVTAERTALLAGSGVDLDYFQPIPKPPSDTLAFALIARLLWDKGIGEYVEAARIVKKKYPQVVFRLVGPKAVQNKTAISNTTIEEWIAEGVIEYLGETDNVQTIIAAQDCIVLPSYREGLSRVLLEAAAMGKPLIASNVAGCKQVVDDGENGFLCRVRDAADLADKLVQFIALTQEQRAQMGQKSREKAEKEFDENLVFKAYLEKILHVTF
jgi:glycosyltransferase involved in cell wall biosynthesis